MNVGEFAMRVNFPDEITSNPEWYRLAQKATELLNEEVRDSGVVLPTFIVDWNMQVGANSTPVFDLKLSDIPNDPYPVFGKISLEEMRREESLQLFLHRLWGRLLRQRSQRQAEALGRLIKARPSFGPPSSPWLQPFLGPGSFITMASRNEPSIGQRQPL